MSAIEANHDPCRPTPNLSDDLFCRLSIRGVYFVGVKDASGVVVPCDPPQRHDGLDLSSIVIVTILLGTG